MKTFYIYVLLFMTCLVAGCYPLTGGYHGPKDTERGTRNVYFDIKERTLYLTDTSEDYLYIYVTADNTQIFKNTDKSRNTPKSFYKFPETFFDAYMQSKIEMTVFPAYNKEYSVTILPEDWKKKEVVFGFYNKH